MDEQQQMRTQELLLLGEIKGLVQSLKEGQDEQNKRFDRVDQRLDKMDGRLRVVEQKAAIAGAVSGGAMAIGTALIVEGIKHWIGRGGGTP